MATTVHELATRLEDTFSTIERERMADVPILNRKLRVEAVGFREWDDALLGVLITPWFMNLMLLPRDADEAPPPRQCGDTSTVAFPAAECEFIDGEEPGIGRYRMCSLYSPVFEFEDHAAAVETARAVLEQLMIPAGEDAAPGAGEAEKSSTETVSRRDLFRGLADRREARPA